MGDIYEFNRFIQLIADKKKRNKRLRDKLNAIKTVEDLKQFLKDEALERTADAFINNKELLHKLLKRLVREKLVNFSNVNEEFGNYIDPSDENSFYLVNPTSKEIDELKTDMVRFFADNASKKLYVFPAWTYTHQRFSNAIKKPRLFFLLRNKQGFSGTATKKGNKWIMLGSDEIKKHFKDWGNRRDIMKVISDRWYDKYIVCSPYLIKLSIPIIGGTGKTSDGEKDYEYD